MISTFVLSFLLLLVIVGEILPKNRILMRCVYIKQAPEEIFKLIIDKEHYAWRSNVKQVRIIKGDGNSPGSKFKEVIKSGLSVEFEVYKCIPNKKYELVTKNFGLESYWKVNLKKYERGTKLFITKETYIENPIIRVFYYIFSNFRTAIDYYADDIMNEVHLQINMQLEE